MDNLCLIHEELKNRKIKQAIGKYILRWGHEPKGSFTTKEAYHLTHLTDIDNPDPKWSKIWNLKTWLKIYTFLWILRHKRTLTWDNILKRGFYQPFRCVLCKENEETSDHLFLKCGNTKEVWRKVTGNIYSNFHWTTSGTNLFNKW